MTSIDWQGRANLRILALSLLFAAPPVIAQQPTLRERMIAAEDARAQTDAELATLRQGLANRDPKLRRQAVRAIGRLERADLIRDLTQPLADADADVRAEAANAIGQSARGPKGVADAKARLIVRARTEPEPRVWGVIAATLGRLAYTTASDVDEVETIIAAVLPGASATSIQIDAVLGATEGLEALARQSGKISKLKSATLDGLRAASKLEGRAQDADRLARIRRFATLALTAAGAVTRPQLEAGAGDIDEEVRRLIMVAARAAIDGREAVIAKGLAEGSARVRYEALQTWGRLPGRSCDPIVKAAQDGNPHVALLAIDLLGGGCPSAEVAVAALRPIAEALTNQPGQWHKPAHAIVALAKAASADARQALPRYLSHDAWQVRMYAARAAGALAAVDELVRLADDSHANVREAALAELVTLKRPEAARVAIAALLHADYQLVMTAARALATTTDKDGAVKALNAAYTRITAENRETSRDAREAIVKGLTALGAAAPALDARVTSPKRDAMLSAGDLDALATTRLRFTMRDRGTFVLRLFPDEAPVTAAHVTRLAREGYYNGLTFHRVVPNFVIQGGSPGANEYMGQGPYMRDEVGLLSHRRGSVGISTRGRDTGDAQLFINLVDSPRLDHTYTVFADVADGMEVVDALLEGDVIERVDVVVVRP